MRWDGKPSFRPSDIYAMAFLFTHFLNVLDTKNSLVILLVGERPTIQELKAALKMKKKRKAELKGVYPKVERMEMTANNSDKDFSKGRHTRGDQS